MLRARAILFQGSIGQFNPMIERNICADVLFLYHGSGVILT